MNVQSKAEELIRLGRQEVVLDEARLEQNRARVLSRVAAAAVVAAGAAASGSAGAVAASKLAFTMSLGKLAVLAVLAGGSVAGGYVLAMRTQVEPVSVQASRSATQVAEMPATAPGSAVTASQPASSVALTESEPRANTRSTASAGRPRPAASSLSEHAELLRDARAALAAGDALGALGLLDGHREVAQGPLGPEWLAARILVLCRLGRTAEAKQLGAKFLKSHGSSPLAAQVGASCAGAD